MSKSTWSRRPGRRDAGRVPGGHRPLSANPPGHSGVPTSHPVRSGVIGPVEAAGTPGQGAYAEPIERALVSKKEITAQFYLTDWLFAHGSPPAFGTTRMYRARGGGGGTGGPRQARLRDPDAVRHRRDLQKKLADEVPGPRLHPVRFGLVPLPDAADGRTTREHAVLPAFPDRWRDPRRAGS